MSSPAWWEADTYNYSADLFLDQPQFLEEGHSSVVANVLDWNVIITEFKPHSGYYVHFRIDTLGKRMNPLMLMVEVK